MLKVIIQNQGQLEDFLNGYHTKLLDILRQRAAKIEELEPLMFHEVLEFLESNGLSLQNGESLGIPIKIEVANIHQILIFEKIEDLSDKDQVYVRFFLQKL
ncbi:hypothetical protein [Listeria valentina]|uniref:hypothetical protein n=1 Tax=Listeria valentina TaxID=2705293 RepID=UPI001431E2D2|nr:hypothetical protein [Listeria valentina]